MLVKDGTQESGDVVHGMSFLEAEGTDVVVSLSLVAMLVGGALCFGSELVPPGTVVPFSGRA